MPARTIPYLTAAGLALVLAFPQASLARVPPRPLDGRDAAVPSAAGEVTAWIRETADNQGLPFLIVDKVNAQVLAFDPEGRLLGTAPALLGLARGDVSPLGVGMRVAGARHVRLCAL